VDKVATRLEFSDLMWEMQGELGTSHAYELGGDHRAPPSYPIGHLGADFVWDARARGYRITHIVRGAGWEPERDSPLRAPGVNVSEGDVLLAINARPLAADMPPAALLVNQAGVAVELRVAGPRGRNPRSVIVKTLRSETPARYREWVQRNRARVHEATGGRAGYIHIPDMGAPGYAEFHRSYLSELDREGLVVDVRSNGGGHVSQILLEKLARRRIGYAVTRWGSPEPYPSDSVLGPMVCITDEQAGSDGDIFTHCFKLLKLGPVVGKRTWGGVVGISPSHRLADGSVTTQPEASYWFTDVGFGVENYGTDPDFDVDVTPQDYAAGRDPQMDKSLQLIGKALSSFRPRVPDTKKRPNLALPVLPKRS
jgi:tricorn protease